MVRCLLSLRAAESGTYVSSHEVHFHLLSDEGLRGASLKTEFLYTRGKGSCDWYGVAMA